MDLAAWIATFLSLALLSLPLIYHRLSTILNPDRPQPRRRRHEPVKVPRHLLIVLGSGGHTAEMIAMLRRAVNEEDSEVRLAWRDFPMRTWVISSGDSISAERVGEFEGEVADAQGGEGVGLWNVEVVPRAREIYQPLYTAPVSSLRCLGVCLGLLGKRGHPDLMLCNGPATATILVFASVMLRFFNIGGCMTRGKMRTIYVESWARVKRLSLSGWLLCRVVDRFLVQWPTLEGKGKGRAEYVGVLV
ncbi:UDP-N-acetylglucosamine transferase subunit alg14 [Fulvia fulva]|uniref:UDP-N-acetylglucosamine transferase subunit ALG14 n=1 Tax=Passalora fulva TaxID=5499 RepID=A0A9Q8UW13_PASFU|nr:UDP-N-acetylglucosamine transferase subunit alg14 [Fulvia fulva]UJO24505.1 UDP-N-acetylglucosamine transferase subunit alg14 [Fulvia fulva]WPV22014.1 UDP-N-acetylglucosamine transferase subunit alg14 [Fulvia fulva]WPV36872.1 UDP-N-acetylglucosamine transferase subunit alg14 [Fulvia fulva]